MDLDSYLQSEMEDLNDMFQEFETQDQQKKRRARDEEEKIMTKVSYILGDDQLLAGSWSSVLCYSHCA